MEAAVIGYLVGPVLRRLVYSLREAAAEGRLRDVPEQALNLSVLTEAFLRLVASGLGKLALVWATVVVLGGFSRELVKKDFWFTTAIILIQTARVVGYNSGPEAKFFVNAPAASVQRETFGVRSLTGVVGLLTMFPAIITLIPFVAATACMILSIMRLDGIARHDYGKLDTGDRKGNVKPALIFFYAVVLAQGAISISWFIVTMDRVCLAATVSMKYFGTENREGKKMVDRYVTDLLDTCISKGVDSTNNRTLVLFASELLQSEDSADNVSAVLVLDVVIRSRAERTARAVEKICSSKLFVQSLMQLLSSKSIPQATKVTTARIIMMLASKLRLADIPGGANCISSLLDAGFLTTVAERKCMFLHGLLVLGGLACDPGNCREIYNTPDLVSKIIAPVSHALDIITDNDAITTEMVKASLEVVAKLTSGAQESSIQLRRKLSENRRTDNLLLQIFRKTEDQDMKLLAGAILSRLTLGESLRAESADVQRVLRFISNTQITDNMEPHRTLLASLLGLTVKMCDMLEITAETFAQQIPMTPEENEAFARKLNDIVETSSHRLDDDVSLVIMKAATKLATRIMGINPGCIHYFREVNIVQNLDAAVQGMVDLERYVVVTGRADEIENYETLPLLVATARVLLVPPQQH